MKKNLRHILTLLIVVLCGLFGWWAGHGWDTTEVRHRHSPQVEVTATKAAPSTSRRSRQPSRDEFRDGTTVEIFASRVADEVILRFPTGEAYDGFLFALAGSKIHLVDKLDRLRAIRLSYDDWSDLSNLLDGENVVAFDSLPAVPAPSPSGGGDQAGLVGFGDGLLPWLGITSDNSRWGGGVKVAVLDTGIVEHPALPGFSQSIAITPFPQDPAKINGHGTAIASLIGGNDPSAPGIAPAVELVSIRVGDDSGRADSFALAAGILAAVDAGVQIINISMGTTENNPLIEEAVLYAHDQNVVIVAASGNSEQADACYPAAYPSVISVGSVDARGEHLDFSNYGTYLSVTAPGYAINAAWPGNRYSAVSGTSASAPIVTGAIAATMSNGSGVTMTASQAAEIVMNYSNDAGIPGPDSEYGVGILDLGRIMNRGVAGTVDAAITNQRILKSNSPGTIDEIQVTVQNRGTANLINTLVEIITPFGSRQFNATTIAPGGIQTFSMPVRLTGLPKDEPIQVSSSLALGTAGHDITPQNNRRSEMLYAR
ncbi:MAG: S8 family serine peptidase [Verrucomicrobiota bacterium]